MTEKFISDIWLILRKNYSDEIILKNIKNRENNQDITKAQTYTEEYLLDTEIDLYARESNLADWLKRFLNNLDLVNNDLNKFNEFYSELEELLENNNFQIQQIGDHYEIETPTILKEYEEMSKMMDNNEEVGRWEKEKLKMEINDKKIARKNKGILIEFLKISDVYLKILKKYFIDSEIDFETNLKFIETVNKMREIIKIISLGITSVNSYEFNIEVPFESLYSIQDDWNQTLKKDNKRAFKIIKNEDLNYENLKKIISSYQTKISLLIKNEYINILPSEPETKVKYYNPSDYLKEVIDFLKDEYVNKRHSIKNLSYEFCIGELLNHMELSIENTEEKFDDNYYYYKVAIKKLSEIGVIKNMKESYKTHEITGDVFVYADFNIDEYKLMGDENNTVNGDSKKDIKEYINEISFVSNETRASNSSTYSIFFINQNLNVTNKITNGPIKKILEHYFNKDISFNENDYKSLNRGNSSIYCRGIYNKTTIIEKKNKKYSISPKIKINILSKNVYDSRLKRKQ